MPTKIYPLDGVIGMWKVFKDLGENGIVTLVRCPKDYSQQDVCLEARLYSYGQGRPAEGG